MGSFRSRHVGERSGLQASSARCAADFRKPSRCSLADEACVMFRTVAAATALWAVFLCAPAAAQTCGRLQPGEEI